MRILLVEDDEDLCGLIETNLILEGHGVDICHQGEDGLYWMRKRIHDLVLLDRMLPSVDGITLLKAARREGLAMPIIMMTALGSLPQVVEGLDSGADDYIVKPFAMAELLARVRAIARRPVGFVPQEAVYFDDLKLEPNEKMLYCGDATSSLSKRETDLLELLMKNPDKTLPRMMIFSYIWGLDAPVEEANLDNYIHFVRERLKQVGSNTKIKTMRGVGYRLEGADV